MRRLRRRIMPWVYLFLAGLLEIVWAYAMKRSLGLTRPDFAIIMLAAMAGSFVLLALAMRQLPLGTAYTVWTGIGAVGAFAVGVLILGEELSVLRLLAVGLILTGMVLLKLA